SRPRRVRIAGPYRPASRPGDGISVINKARCALLSCGFSIIPLPRKALQPLGFARAGHLGYLIVMWRLSPKTAAASEQDSAPPPLKVAVREARIEAAER